MFTARFAPSPFLKQKHFIFTGLSRGRLLLLVTKLGSVVVSWFMTLCVPSHGW